MVPFFDVTVEGLKRKKKDLIFSVRILLLCEDCIGTGVSGGLEGSARVKTS